MRCPVIRADCLHRRHRPTGGQTFARRRNLRVSAALRFTPTLLIVWLALAIRTGRSQAGELPVDVVPRRLDHLEAGLVVNHAAPDGWSHLILKSQPLVARGDVDKVPSMVVRHSGFLFTVFAADVASGARSGGPPFHLAKVGVGLGTLVKGKPMIVSSATHRALEADLGLLRSIILSQSEKQLDLIVRRARTPTMAVFDAPGYFARSDGHRPIALRYHVLVEPATGRLATVIWLLEIKSDPPRYVLVDGTTRLLKPGVIEKSLLDVDANEFILGMPKPSAFALTSLPPGDELVPSQRIRTLATRVHFQPAEVVRLEADLWQMINRHEQEARRR